MKMRKLKSKSKQQSPKRLYGNVFKASFVSGAGMFLGIVPQLSVAILLFIVGLSLKNKADESKTQGLYYYIGIAIMILGSALGLGLGSNILFSEIFE